MQDTLDFILREIQQPLIIFGFAAQFIFFMRFVVQWLASERRGESHVPIAFWYLSLVGGLMTLVYAILRKDIVFATAMTLSSFIYIRNLMLIYAKRARDAAETAPVLGHPAGQDQPSPPSSGTS
jgi:lipid-A-disaccharide synthase-like uncharacterized protein